MVRLHLRVPDRWFLIASLFAAVRAWTRHAQRAGRAAVWNRAAMRKETAENPAIVLRINLTYPRSLAIIRRQGRGRLNGERVSDEMAGRFGRRVGVGSRELHGVV